MFDDNVQDLRVYGWKEPRNFTGNEKRYLVRSGFLTIVVRCYLNEQTFQ